MIKTTIEWYTLDEKLPTETKYVESGGFIGVLCAVEVRVDYENFITYKILKWENGRFLQYSDRKCRDYTEHVKYWAYVPMI